MAANPDIRLTYADGCPDCGSREANLPKKLAEPGDDFDWLLRDYDGFRLFMLQELAARFPERRRWTPADVEVAIVEVLAAVLDQLSDTLDRISAEAFLETARQPASVRRLLAMIGYDAVTRSMRTGCLPDASPDAAESDEQRVARLACFLPAMQSYLDDYSSIIDALGTDVKHAVQDYLADPETIDTTVLQGLQDFLDAAPDFVLRAQRDALDACWLRHPREMERHRLAGPREIHTQERMVTAEDYANRLEEHPLVQRAAAWSEWGGSWDIIKLAVSAWDNRLLDEGVMVDADTRELVDDFHSEHGLPEVYWETDGSTYIRLPLRQYVDAWRMAGQEVVLLDAAFVGIHMSISLQLDADYFQTEMRQAVVQALGTGPQGFFSPGRLQFGEDLHASDIYEVLMVIDGVDAVCINRFKRVGSQFPDVSDSGIIALTGLEIAVCENQPDCPERGYYRLHLHGGKRG